MNRVIDVSLYNDNGNDILCFKSDPDISVCLNSDSQQDLKKAFSRLLELSTTDNISLNLLPAGDYDNALIKEVCKEYIDALNTEIKQVMEEVRSYFKAT